MTKSLSIYLKCVAMEKSWPKTESPKGALKVFSNYLMLAFFTAEGSDRKDLLSIISSKLYNQFASERIQARYWRIRREDILIKVMGSWYD